MEQTPESQPILTKKQRRAIAKEQKMAERGHMARTGSLKRWGMGSVTAIIIVLGIWWLASTAGAPKEAAGDLGSAGHAKGNPEAGLTLVEFSDFQCPACGAYFPLVKRLADEFKDSVRFVYRHYPLTSIHSNAEPSAWAAEAAGAQDTFWEMHDMLFERQSEWSNIRNPKDTFADYAESLGLSRGQFLTDYESDSVRNAVDVDARLARRLNIPGTPTFFLDGEQIESPQGYDEFRALLVSRVGEPIAADDAETATSTAETPE